MRFDVSALRRHVWTLLVALIVIVAWGRGSLGALDEAVFDPLAWVAAKALPAETSTVIALETVADYQDGEVDWPAVLRSLAAHDAAGAVLLYRPASADGLPDAPLPLVIGRPARFGAEGMDLAPWHLGAAAETLAAPLFALHPAGGSYDRVRVAGDGVASAEQRAANFVTGAVDAGRTFVLPDFTRRVPIPRVRLDALLEQGIPGDLLRGKVVALVRPEAAGDLRIRVPAGWESETTLRLRAIDALVRGAYVGELAWPLGVALLLVWAALMLWLFARTDAVGSLYLALAVTAGLLALESAAVAGLALRLPLAELWVLMLIAWIGTRYAGFVDTQQEISARAGQLGALVRTRILPDDLLLSEDYWNGIGRMVYQLLELERSIFLEKVPGDHRVREVHAIACSIDDIEERRRDFERDPYRTAIARGGAIPVSGYLTEAGDETFLIALTFDNLVVGFWALGLRPGAAEGDPQVLALAGAFAREIGELLYRRSMVEPEEGEPGEFAVPSGDRALLLELASNVTLTGRRLETVEQVFMGLDSAVVMFDVFGRVLLANHRIEGLMERWQIPLFDASYVDLMAHLTGLSLTEARARMRQIVVRRDPWQMVIASPDDPEERWLLHVHPIVDEVEEAPGVVSPGREHPFGVACVALELIDWAEAGSAEGYRRPLLERLATRLAEYAGRLDRDPEALSRVQGVLDVAGRFLFPSGARPSRVPMPLRAGCERVVQQIAADLDARGVEVEISGGEQGAFALIEPGTLQRVLHGALMFLVRDARPGSTVRVEVADSGAGVSIENDGVGLPDAQLSAILDLAQAAGHDDDELRDALRELRAAGGDAEFESEVGVGTRCRLRFEALGL